MEISEKNFEAIACPHLDAVYRAAYALCGDASAAEDLVQTAYLKAFERFHTYREGSSCKAWLLTILRNTWIDRLRHSPSQEHMLGMDENLMGSAVETEEITWTNADDLLENFSDEMVIKALHRLPPDLRLTLFLVDVEQYSHEQTAQIMAVAVGTIKSRTSRARNWLKKELAQYAKDMGYKR